MKINNIVRSKTATKNNPDRCWMNISLERMGMFLNTDYVFECIIDGVEYIYNGSVSELLNAFKAYEVDVMKNPDRYSFYLDYRDGKIYKRVSENDRDAVFSLQKIEDVTLSVRQSRNCNITSEKKMRALFMDWLMENEYAPNTANNYSSLVNTSHRLAEKMRKDNFYTISDAETMERISCELMQTDEFLHSNNREVRRNALARYVEFLRQSQADEESIREIEGKQEMKPVESCQWEKLLRTVGISTFVKYYFVFKFYSTDKCVQAFVEDYTLDSKRAKASAARAIFSNGSHIEVLKYIRDMAGKIPDEQKANASWYLRLEE